MEGCAQAFVTRAIESNGWMLLCCRCALDLGALVMVLGLDGGVFGLRHFNQRLIT